MTFDRRAYLCAVYLNPRILQLLILACVAFLGIQIIYLSLFLYAFSKDKSVPGQGTQAVSVVVCAHDEETNLRELIPLLLRQDHPEFEVIIVDDRSNDGNRSVPR